VASVTTTSFTNLGLTNGTTSFYVVSAVNASGESASSTQVSATPQAAGFSLTATPASLTITRRVWDQHDRHHEDGRIHRQRAFTATGLPSGVTASFAPARPPGRPRSSRVCVGHRSGRRRGARRVRIRGGQTQTTSVALMVTTTTTGTGGVTVTR